MERDALGVVATVLPVLMAAGYFVLLPFMRTTNHSGRLARIVDRGLTIYYLSFGPLLMLIEFLMLWFLISSTGPAPNWAGQAAAVAVFVAVMFVAGAGLLGPALSHKAESNEEMQLRAAHATMMATVLTAEALVAVIEQLEFIRSEIDRTGYDTRGRARSRWRNWVHR